jgi:iron complex transport system substrate-binding protein
MRPSLIILHFILFISAFTKTAISADLNEGRSKRVIALTSFGADVTNKISSRSLVAIPESKLLAEDPNMKKLPTVSKGRNQPSVEKIISLKPDFVIGASGFHDKVLRKLDKLGISTISYKINDIDSIQLLADRISSSLSQPSIVIKKYIPACFPKTSIKQIQIYPILVVVGFKPIIAPTSNSWSGSLLRHLSIPNLTSSLPGSGQFSGYATLSPEWVIKSNPKSLAVITFPNADPPNLSDKPIWKSISAVKSNKIKFFNYYGLINPGSFNSINNACQKLLNI